MNKIKLLSLGALMVTAMYANAQTTAHTKPTGYVTHTLKAGQFNLIGLTLHNPVVASGDIQGFTGGTQITDNDINFANVLTAGKTYILEITDAADTSLNGTIQEVTVWDTNTFDTPQDLETEGLAVGDKYQLRACKTISDIFGADNSAGLTGGASASLADNIYIPTVAGFDIYYYSTGGFFGVGWRKVGSGATDFATLAFVSSDGFYIYRQPSSDLDFVLTGAVKTINTSVAVTGKYTFVSAVYPVGATLDSSGMQNSLTGGASASIADNVYIQNATSAFDIYYYSTGGFFGVGWRKVGAASVDQGDVPLPSAFIIARTGTTDFNVDLSEPAGYEDL